MTQAKKGPFWTEDTKHVMSPWRDLLADYEDRDPEAPLVGFIAAGPALTVLHGTGGTGKGTLVAWLLARMVAQNPLHRIAIIDAEQYPHEWRRRIADHLRIMGAEWPADSIVHWSHPGGDFAGITAEMMAAVDLVVVDSAAYFRAEDQSDDDTWKANALALRELSARVERPVLAIAHSSKAQPGQAYGSVFIRNAARLSWGVEQGKLTCTKANDILGVEEGQQWDISFAKDERGRISEYTVEPDNWEVALDWLDAAEEGRTKEEVMEYMGVSQRTAERWLKEYATNVSTSRRAGARYKAKRVE